MKYVHCTSQTNCFSKLVWIVQCTCLVIFYSQRKLYASTKLCLKIPWLLWTFTQQSTSLHGHIIDLYKFFWVLCCIQLSLSDPHSSFNLEI